MKFKSIIIIVLPLLLVLSSACGADSDSGTDSETVIESNVNTPQTETTDETQAGEESAPAPDPVTAKASVNLNLRQGPGTNYSIVDSLPEQSEINVIGRNEDGSWLLAETESGQEVWLSGDPDLVEVDSNLVSGLPVVEAPPPSYNASNPDVNAVLNLIPLVVHHEGNQTCASHGGINNLLPDVVEGHVIGPHANDFVMMTGEDQGDNVLFKVSNGTLVLIRENSIARFEGGAETLPLDQALKMFETREIIWNGEFGQPGRGVPGCDESTP